MNVLRIKQAVKLLANFPSLQSYWKALTLHTVFNLIFISLSILGSVKHSTSFIEEIENWPHKGKKKGVARA